MVFLKKAYSSLAHLPKCTLFVSQNFAQVLFSISLGTAVIPKRNEKQRLCKLFFFFEGANKKYYGRCANGEFYFEGVTSFLFIKYLFDYLFIYLFIYLLTGS